MVDWVWAAARARGTSHAKSGMPCQDAFRCRLIGDAFVAVVADGAGSANYGGQGAIIASRTFLDSAARYLATSAGLPNDQCLWSWVDAIRDRIAVAAKRRGDFPRDFASTLVCVLAAPAETLLIHIGDGVAALRASEGGSWSVPLWPAHGEYASTTFFVTDDPAPQVRIKRVAGGTSAVVAMSDGLERLALDFASQSAHAPFFDTIVKPVAASTEAGHHAALSRQLGAYLQSDAINTRTDDDKTLVVAVRR